MTKQPKQVKAEPDPAWRVDILVQKIIDVSLKRTLDNHPLTARLKAVGLDVPAITREAVQKQLKRDRITNVRSVLKALRRS